VVRGMQKHVELDEPEESQELELDTTIFGIDTSLGAAMDGELDAVGDAEDMEEDEDEEDNEGEEALAEESAADVTDLDEDDELAEDILGVEEEVDLADASEPDAPGDFDEEV